MSRLEENTKLIIVGMLSGTITTLSRGDLRTLARWADKTAMVREVGGTQDVVSTMEQRKRFISLKGADPRSEIWMGTFVDPEGPLRHRHYAWAEPSDGSLTARQDSMVVGPVVFLIINSIDDRGAGYSFNFNEDEHAAPYWVKIWPSPPANIRWPLSLMNYRQFFYVSEERFWVLGLIHKFELRTAPGIISGRDWAALSPDGLRLVPGIGWH